MNYKLMLPRIRNLARRVIRRVRLYKQLALHPRHRLVQGVVIAEANLPLPGTLPGGRPWPKISVITPSFNQGRYIAETIESVLNQDYPNVEHIIIDGGSSDDTMQVVERYRQHLAHVVSEADRGQYDAINQGFALSTGDIMAWLNADDVYLPGTLPLVAKIFEIFPQINWLTTRHPLVIDAQGQMISTAIIPGFSAHGFLCGDNLPAMGPKCNDLRL